MAQVAEATGPLPEVAEASRVLPPMDERMAQIEAAMPTLVEVQQQLADLPRTMDELQARLGGVTETLERLLSSLDTLDANVGSLRGSIEPIGRVADQAPRPPLSQRLSRGCPGARRRATGRARAAAARRRSRGPRGAPWDRTRTARRGRR